ncbi:MAG: UDP-glucose 4-epimerase GalE [Lentisphaerae bacterium]|jgi:UDP-glucose 4-epimerase|nr:UDP-glucose 4-epimerase GalE [Lentisphaerota bacterium]
MKILVTGGSGYIGSVTLARLLQAGHRVHVFDNLERGHREALPPGIPLTVGDLRDAAAIADTMAAVRPDAVMHFAAYALVGESMRQPELYFVNNVTGGINLLEAMRAAGVKQIVFSSSCATYGEPGSADIDESTLQSPTNPYGESKLIFEKMLRWYSGIHGFRTIALRYFNACGATETLGEDHADETHLIPLVLRVALGQSPHVKIFGDDYDTPDGTCIRDYVHVVDLAEAHLQALERGVTGAMNLGTGRGFSVKEVVEACRRVTGHPIPAIISPRRPGDPGRLVARAALAGEKLGWQPRFTEIDEIVATAWRWHQAHPHGYA